ncbi:MAG: Type secretion system, TraD, DNA-binding domain protein [Candidatus Sulfotelmatobacter sp.]|nr:Type secretion system, TraD, DNA-binding domain protein [Candidatus Sulfotelmatobacter sp.]
MVLIAGVLGFGIFVYEYWAWTPLQRWYWYEYLATQTFPSARGNYWLISKSDRNGHHSLAGDTDLVPDPSGQHGIPFELSQQARQRGAVQLFLNSVPYSNAQMKQILAGQIFAGQSPDDLIRPAWVGALGFLVLGLVFAIPRDRARRGKKDKERRLKGPEMVTVGEFNRQSGADGISFLTTESKQSLSIPRSLESSHMMMMGDTGAGKSVLQRRVLMQIAERGETAIVYDPALEHTPQFFNPARGDLILNPLDVRCPYWSPSDEVMHEAEALTLATSLFPDKPHENTFFVEGPRKIFAHLLTLKPTPEELVRWMSHEEELDRLFKGTELTAFIYRGAGPQRGGVLGALNMVADSLKLLPKESETKQRWTTEEWAQQRSGWIFLTSTPRFRERLLPLMSLWLDTLVLRLMNQGDPAMRHAWFVLDELASLQRLPQLHTALTENRKSGNPVVIGFQGRSQLEVRYGHEAEAMLSQPATKIFLHTSEPRAAKWISDTIGEVEMERVKETVNTHPLKITKSRSYHTERRTEPLVLPSEISGLQRLHALLKVDNLVVPFSFPYLAPVKTEPGFIPREITPRVIEIGERPPQPSTVAAQEISPRESQNSEGIAAGQEPYFE